ncbi:rnp domain protein [Stylonychia lemnae]|uniref:Rnp domain protein n=1 Tax=Stylonychia lemnae TaxID=5949 RepID=A0A078A5L6_STYLE|nr:rnp domain protein [Stylonychia lemnae]|eukprot:CDW77189.1 rnp domain protein [Stylonychia lemnae]
MESFPLANQDSNFSLNSSFSSSSNPILSTSTSLVQNGFDGVSTQSSTIIQTQSVSSNSNIVSMSSTVNSTPVLRKQHQSIKKEPEDEELILARSIFIKNVDYSTNKRDLEDHFKDCGSITRCKIATDKATGQPLGYAYIEFATNEGAQRSKLLNDSLFKGRQITVMEKRKNKPGMGKSGYKQQKMLMQNQHATQILAQAVSAALSGNLMGNLLTTGLMGRGRGLPNMRGANAFKRGGGGRFRPY